MKAVIFDEFGPPSMLQLKTDVPVPVRKPGEVLVKIISTSVNPIDYKTRKGEVPRAFVKRPKVNSPLTVYFHSPSPSFSPVILYFF